MQRKLGNEVELKVIVLPFHSIGGSSAIDKTTSNYEEFREKVKKGN